MKTFLKNIVSFILPVTVLILVPRWIESDWAIQSNLNLIGGIVLMGTGLTVMFFTISSFIRVGKGTLAPWSPTKKLVVMGLYRYVRNPMMLGVLTVLLGEATLFSSVSILQWAGIFFLINTTYFILSEEPGLRSSAFGIMIIRCTRKVWGVWIPRLTPYQTEITK